ncbi:hypothetical protein Dda_9004 [Drechslerella dactyloides]|uniref:Uncharacterized protein n=1 Tax=Drechslerella dactyloides TaxID=74499 RepID=A0AAD6IPU4_DREDA|nr:hypothetical protein Dda_9004 [Drechslerella dactyloides]
MAPVSIRDATALSFGLLSLLIRTASAYYQYSFPIAWEDKPSTALVNSPVSQNFECRNFKPKRVVQPTSYEAVTIYNAPTSFVTSVVALYRDYECKGAKGGNPAMLLVLDPDKPLGVNIADFKKLRYFAQVHSAQSVDFDFYDRVIQRLTGEEAAANRVYHWNSAGVFLGTSDAEGLVQNFAMEDIATPEELEMVASENTRDIEIVLGRVTNRVLGRDPERQEKIELLEAIAPQLLRPPRPRMALRPAAPRPSDTLSANQAIQSVAPVVDTARSNAGTSGMTPEQIANRPIDTMDLVMQYIDAPDKRNWFRTVVAEAYQAQKRVRAAYDILQTAALVLQTDGQNPETLAPRLSEVTRQHAGRQNGAPEGLQPQEALREQRPEDFTFVEDFDFSVSNPDPQQLGSEGVQTEMPVNENQSQLEAQAIASSPLDADDLEFFADIPFYSAQELLASLGLPVSTDTVAWDGDSTMRNDEAITIYPDMVNLFANEAGEDLARASQPNFQRFGEELGIDNSDDGFDVEEYLQGQGRKQLKTY